MRSLLLLVVLTVGCGGDGPPNVGGECTSQGGCDTDLMCNVAVPGGYCTTGCVSPGSTTECPDDSVCDSVTGAAISCVKICKTGTDCRPDQDCNGVTSTNIKACKPKP